MPKHTHGEALQQLRNRPSQAGKIARTTPTLNRVLAIASVINEQELLEITLPLTSYYF